MRKSIAKMQIAHCIKLTIVWTIGTNTIEQVWAMNCPEALQTATANLILPKQQSINRRNMPPKPKAIPPQMVYCVLVAPEMVGMFMYPLSVLFQDMIPALQKKTKPTAPKSNMMPTIELQTKSPAHHFKEYIKMKDITIVIPSAIKIYFQFYIIE